MAVKDLVTVQELADVIGLPGFVDAVCEGLITGGYTIHDDWAGRPAVTVADAKATVDQYRAQQTEWQDRQRREFELNAQVHDAQQRRNSLLTDAYSREILGHAHPSEAAWGAAVQHVVDLEGDLPDEVRERLVWDSRIKQTRRFG